jgi:hypothetical protein
MLLKGILIGERIGEFQREDASSRDKVGIGQATTCRATLCEDNYPDANVLTLSECE